MFLINVKSWATDMDTPKKIVKSYLNDYYLWNTYANEVSRKEKNNSGDAMDLAVKKYQEVIIDKYCRPGFSGQGIAFGSESSHEVGKELIISENVSKLKAILRTKHTGLYDFISDYEYRFQKVNNKWYLEAVDYIDGNNKYPGL